MITATVTASGPTPLAPADGSAKMPGHGEAFVKSGSLPGAATRLTWREQLTDAATIVIVLTHVAAFATPFIYGISWRDVALVALTYNLRMFGAS